MTGGVLFLDVIQIDATLVNATLGLTEGHLNKHAVNVVVVADLIDHQTNLPAGISETGWILAEMIVNFIQVDLETTDVLHHGNTKMTMELVQEKHVVHVVEETTELLIHLLQKSK